MNLATRQDQALRVEVKQATSEDRLPIQRMLELYQHDLSDIWDQDIDARGEYGYALDRFWSSAGCKAFVVGVGDHYAGFALVDRESKVGKGAWWMDQFFVLKKFRRRGIGAILAREVLTALPGAWEVGQMANNLPAQAFWRHVVSGYTGGRYVERQLAGGWWQGAVQCFQSPGVQR